MTSLADPRSEQAVTHGRPGQLHGQQEHAHLVGLDALPITRSIGSMSCYPGGMLKLAELARLSYAHCNRLVNADLFAGHLDWYHRAARET